jgi:C4-dicarboxylate transporter DctM subunit
LIRAIPGLLVPVIILGGIYSGIVTPTESAIVAVAYALFVGLVVYRDLKVKQLYNIGLSAVVQSSVVMVIVGSASMFGYVVTRNNIATSFAETLFGLSTNPVVVMLICILLLVVIGAFIDAVSALYLFVPILVPVLLEMGYDITTIGVMMTVNLALGLMTPPVGVNLFVAAGLAKTTLWDTAKSAVPFMVTGLLITVLVAYVPALSNWLPDLLLK